ncbi:MAG: choice-of-anchor tandem repeat GloVer-containing protein [Candidatus Cybelea sp.]
MSESLVSRHAMGICAAAAILSGCAGSQSPGGAPAGTLPFERQGPVSTKSAEQVLYSFSGGNDGGDAASGLVIRGGNLYGTTVVGGTYACGTIFKLAPKKSVPWHESVLYSFDCYGTGKTPYGGVTFDRKGSLYGSTVSGGSGGSCGSSGCGVVFQLTAQAAENVLHSFTGGNDGFGPGGSLAIDSTGHLYGTTPDGGTNAEGTVYEISRSRRTWHESVIHAFTGGKDGGVGSLGTLLVDSSGDLYGVTEIGGAHSAGTVFKMTRASKNRWNLKTLYAFKGTPDAASPYGGLIQDASGNLYGTTYYGGAHGFGSVFELIASARGKYHDRVLYSFRGGSDGSSPTSTLIAGASGRLYGTTSAGGGSCDCGTIFDLDATSGSETVLHSFGSSGDGAYPYYGLTQDSGGNLYGTTVQGGTFNQGAVFELTP